MKIIQVFGPDEMIVKHDSVMLEACNTSFQLHFQVDPEEFARLYNISQLVTAPLLAAATNSPLLFGRQLWRETRIAVFQQAVDTRRSTSHLREVRARVSFGNQWVKDSILELFREDIARYRVLFGSEREEDPFAVLEKGGIPELKALQLHNSTIYRWNRPCYGLYRGKAHLRIENRVLPSGPSVVDAVANAAFYFGMMSGISREFRDVSPQIDFTEVRDNFLSAARVGLKAQFHWLDGKTVPARDLICRQLLPLARQGLESRGIDKSDIQHFLDIIAARVESAKTGSQWLVDSYSGMEDQGKRGERLAALTAGAVARQNEGTPVHLWDLARLEEAGDWKLNYMRVEQFMTTDLFTVHPEDTLDLVANLMNWQHIRHVPVEDNAHRLIGLISYRTLLRSLCDHPQRSEEAAVPATSIMKKEPVCVSPETTTLEAIKIMRRHRVGCLPVVAGDRLVGIITERDFMEIASQFLERTLSE